MRRLSLFAAMVVVVIATACSVSVKKDDNGQDKNVDINTPFGGIHVNENADVRDTGLPVYAVARQKKKDDSGDEKSGNVKFWTYELGVKLFVVVYVSVDAL